ncbi:MAG TPA: fumarylacetoacetate hydrolase family protein [Actinomycetaceae bacterium]|nr:fumarylacetoacetate hydrolase family protein [Actinomycetaceae bacterium]
MQVARFAHGESPAYGVVDDGDLVVLRSDPLFDSYQTTGERVPLDGARLLSPMIPRSKVVGYGSNYRGAPAERPDVPPVFVKPNTSVIGPDDPIVIPEYSKSLIHGAELAVVISRMGKQVPRERAADIIFGYTVANDLGAADYLGENPQWVKAKMWDTSCPIGPWIETDLEGITDGLAVRSYLDGELVVEGTTADMWRSVGELIEEISAVFTLLPGDIILTGTPGPAPVAEGQRVEVEVEGIGRFGNQVLRR